MLIIGARNAVIEPSILMNSGLQEECLLSYLIFKIKDLQRYHATNAPILKYIVLLSLKIKLK